MKIIVIGGGPAGMMSAYYAAMSGAEVILFEKNEKLGKKIYISGKGRCNLTNNLPPREFLNNVVTNSKFLYSALNRFSPQDTMDFFDKYGCPLKTERGGRVFPLSDHSSDILKTFERALKSTGVKINFNTKVLNIEKSGNGYIVTADNTSSLICDCVIIATGGISYPSTGSTGDGYIFAKKLGHTITKLKPCLTAIEVFDDVSDMQGLTLKNVKLTASVESKVIASLQGEMLFTSKGISGPIVLSLSSLINSYDLKKIKLFLDLKPALDKEKLDERVLRDFGEIPNKQFGNSLDALLPRSMISEVIKRSLIPVTKKVNSITKTERAMLIKVLKEMEFSPKQLEDIERAIVTGGGIDVSEINPSTMESRKNKGLFFAGEIIDVDAFTGGYNIQIAMSSGYLAGTNAAKGE